MSLLWIDGFDHYATADILTVFDSKFNSPAILPSSGRFGGGALASPNSTSAGATVSKSLGSSLSTIVIGAAIKITAYGNSAETLFILKEGGTTHLLLAIDTAGVLKLYLGSLSTVVHTSSTVLSLDIFNYVELKANIHDTTGSYEIRVNGVNIGSGSSVDTRSGGTSGVIDNITLGAETSTGFTTSFIFDDLYVLDTTGAAPNNDFLGDVRVDTIFPNAEGNYSQFTPSTGTDNSALVDEATPNGDTDYNSDSTATNKDSYAMTNLAAITTQTIYGVQTSMYMKKTDAGARSAKVGVRSSTTDSVSSAQALSTGYTYYHNMHELDPATAAAWTESGVNAMETLVETV